MIKQDNSIEAVIRVIGVVLIFALFNLYQPLKTMSTFYNLLLFIIMLIIWYYAAGFLFSRIKNNDK